ncbi:MAG: hypothetical protein ACPLPR_05795 [Bacillota bacterium]
MRFRPRPATTVLLALAVVCASFLGCAARRTPSLSPGQLNSAVDSKGGTPDVVMCHYLAACLAKDWVGAFGCLGLIPDDVTLELFMLEREQADDELLEYRVEGYQLLDPEHATVYVSYRFRYRSSGQVFTGREEPWSCMRQDGLWKVRWLPRR